MYVVTHYLYTTVQSLDYITTRKCRSKGVLTAVCYVLRGDQCYRVM